MRIHSVFSVFLLLLFSLGAQAAEPIQSQFHSSGNTVDVMRATVKNGVLTVVLRANAGDSVYKMQIPLEEVYYIDPKQQKKYMVLKDEKGDYIGNPSKNHPVWKHAQIEVRGKNRMLWFKFPAPESDTQTINLVIPDVTPFDDLPIKR